MIEQKGDQQPTIPSQAANLLGLQPSWTWGLGMGLGLAVGAEIGRNLGLPDVGETTGEELGKWLGFGFGAALGGLIGVWIGKLRGKKEPVLSSQNRWLFIMPLVSLGIMGCAALGAMLGGKPGAWIGLGLSTAVFMVFGAFLKRSRPN